MKTCLLSYRTFDVTFKEISGVCYALMNRKTAIAFAPLEYEEHYETELGYQCYEMNYRSADGYRKYLESRHFFVVD